MQIVDTTCPWVSKVGVLEQFNTHRIRGLGSDIGVVWVAGGPTIRGSLEFPLIFQSQFLFFFIFSDSRFLFPVFFFVFFPPEVMIYIIIGTPMRVEDPCISQHVYDVHTYIYIYLYLNLYSVYIYTFT